MTKENILEEYVEEICSICKHRETCQEELRKRIDNSVKCERYENGNPTTRNKIALNWQKW